jgi:peptidoglycan-associated lipoprotein
MKFRNAALALLSLLALGAGCSKKRPAEVAPAPASGPASDAPSRPAAEPPRATPATDANAALERMRSTMAEAVYFGYDRSDLTQEALALLERKLAILRQDAEVRVRVEGHADERGSDEYNLALGQARAAAIKRFFAQRDIDDKRVEIVSYGEERPVCSQSDESCWMRNRRGGFLVLAGLNP